MTTLRAGSVPADPSRPQAGATDRVRGRGPREALADLGRRLGPPALLRGSALLLPRSLHSGAFGWWGGAEERRRILLVMRPHRRSSIGGPGATEACDRPRSPAARDRRDRSRDVSGRADGHRARVLWLSRSRRARHPATEIIVRPPEPRGPRWTRGPAAPLGFHFGGSISHSRSGLMGCCRCVERVESHSVPCGELALPSASSALDLGSRRRGVVTTRVESPKRRRRTRGR